MHDWAIVSDLSEIETHLTGIALIVVGMEGCNPCEIVRQQTLLYVSEHDGVTLKLYKFEPRDQFTLESYLFGEEVRHFPTVIGSIDGAIAFRMHGMLRDANPSDVTRIEKGFERFVSRQ